MHVLCCWIVCSYWKCFVTFASVLWFRSQLVELGYNFNITIFKLTLSNTGQGENKGLTFCFRQDHIYRHAVPFSIYMWNGLNKKMHRKPLFINPVGCASKNIFFLHLTCLFMYFWEGGELSLYFSDFYYRLTKSSLMSWDLMICWDFLNVNEYP